METWGDEHAGVQETFLLSSTLPGPPALPLPIDVKLKTSMLWNPKEFIISIRGWIIGSLKNIKSMVKIFTFQFMCLLYHMFYLEHH